MLGLSAATEQTSVLKAFKVLIWALKIQTLSAIPLRSPLLKNSTGHRFLEAPESSLLQSIRRD